MPRTSLRAFSSLVAFAALSLATADASAGVRGSYQPEPPLGGSTPMAMQPNGYTAMANAVDARESRNRKNDRILAIGEIGALFAVGGVAAALSFDPTGARKKKKEQDKKDNPKPARKRLHGASF